MSGCASRPVERPLDGRHLTAPPPPAGTVPEIVQPPPLPATPEAEPALDVYTVVVHDVPVTELLFVLGRDAQLNVDIHPGISGNVTLNAIDQTLPQILARIARQSDIRWELKRRDLVVMPDRPFLRSYRIDYVNMTRQSSGNVSVSTSIATTGNIGTDNTGNGSNDSMTLLAQESDNRFWDTLIANVSSIVGQGPDGAAAVAANREGGLLTVRATGREHDDIQRFLDLVLNRAQQQVLIEATIVEVELNDRYQAGIDWTRLSDGGDTVLTFAGLGANLAAAPVFTASLGRAGVDDLFATIKMLEQFGDLKVLSSPKLMVLNNQTAMLKVVDNRVYFTIDVDILVAGDDGTRTIVFESLPHTVPVGFVMAVTPQVGESGQIILNVRPTISRILGYVQDPSPALAEAGVVSNVPEIQVREIESVLKVTSGQTAVLGGLMQDSVRESTAGIPGLSRLPLIGQLFSYRDDEVIKTELVIFLRPLAIRDASLRGDLERFREQLPGGPPERRWRLGGT